MKKIDKLIERLIAAGANPLAVSRLMRIHWKKELIVVALLSSITLTKLFGIFDVTQIGPVLSIFDVH